MELNELIKTVEQNLADLKAMAAREAAKAAKTDTRPVTERVKTFEDALRELGDEHPLAKQWWNFEAITDGGEATCDNADLVAYYKLRIITAALNEGWTPTFEECEKRYCPSLVLRNSANCHTKIIKWAGDKYGMTANGAGVTTGQRAPMRLCYKSYELSIYSGVQFIDLWVNLYKGGEA